MKKILATMGVCSLAVLAMSLGTFVKVFDSTYKISPDSKLGKASCLVCHTGKKGGKLNPYGKDLKKAAESLGGKKVTAEVLKKVESLDSNGDGVKNIDEIKADKLPG